VLLGACSSDDTATERVRAVSQNILHGVACPSDSDRCRAPDRVALFVRQLEASGCPELVGVQEANGAIVDLLRSEAKKICGGRYRVVWDDDPGLDREVVLTTDRVLGTRRTRLAGPLRSALWVRVATKVGVVDFITTHLASGSDDRPCDRATCPPPCRPRDRVNTCQARQLARFAADVAHDSGVVIVSGDLNAGPTEPALRALAGAGFTDTHTAVGNRACNPRTGTQCTSGRVDSDLSDLTDPTSRQTERIDYVLVGGPRSCTAARPTGLFNAGPASGDIAFPSDHTAVQATLACETSDSDRAAVERAAVESPQPTTTAASGRADAATLAAITRAYEAVFNGDVTDVERKLGAIEDGESIRSFFLESYEKSKEIAAKVRVRIDGVELIDGTHAKVTYTLLLEGNAVLDHLAGGAVRIDDRWLVTRRTYCDVSSQGSAEIPAPCRDVDRSRP
jgi:endonuclease/exonuclease/phosphatase family metal-dependent hydrolase